MKKKNDIIKKIGIYNIVSIILSKNKKEVYSKLIKLLIINMIKHNLKKIL